MKKILALSLLLGSAILFAPAVEAKTSDVNLSGSVELKNAVSQTVYQNQRYNRRGVRVINRTRIVRRGGRTYREVYQYRYRPNGSATVRLISRTRIR